MSAIQKYAMGQKQKDFKFFVENYKKFYSEYGHKFIAIKNQQVLGVFDSPSEAIVKLSGQYQVGTYCIQECSGDESAYHVTIMRQTQHRSD